MLVAEQTGKQKDTDGSTGKQKGTQQRLGMHFH